VRIHARSLSLSLSYQPPLIGTPAHHCKPQSTISPSFRTPNQPTLFTTTHLKPLRLEGRAADGTRLARLLLWIYVLSCVPLSINLTLFLQRFGL
jgi:hypothetical protein